MEEREKRIRDEISIDNMHSYGVYQVNTSRLVKYLARQERAIEALEKKVKSLSEAKK